MIFSMVKTSLSVVLQKLDTNKRQLAYTLNMRAAWFSDFDNGKIRRIHLDVIQKIIDYAESSNVDLTIADFFIDED